MNSQPTLILCSLQLNVDYWHRSGLKYRPDNREFTMNKSKLKANVLMAAALALLMAGAWWPLHSEHSPFYWYFLDRPALPNLYIILNMVPYIVATIISGNVHGGDLAVFLAAAFVQWFIVLYFPGRLLLKIPRRFLITFAVTVGLLVGVAAWHMAAPERTSHRAQTTRFKELKFGLSKDEAQKYFGAPDLVADNKTVNWHGITAPWTMVHAFPGPDSESLDSLTAVRWIYFHKGPTVFHETDYRTQGLPAKWDTEIGFDGDGKILWFNRIVGTTAVEIDTARLKQP